MNVHGIEISPAVEAACIKRMLRGYSFTAIEIEELAHKLGVVYTHDNRPIAMRVADRLIQRMRKAGQIRYSFGRWIRK